MGFEHGPFVAQQDGTLSMSPYAWNKKMVRAAATLLADKPAGLNPTTRTLRFFFALLSFADHGVV
jgi:hypothetical protein